VCVQNVEVILHSFLEHGQKGLDDPSLSNFGHSVYLNNFSGD